VALTPRRNVREVDISDRPTKGYFTEMACVRFLHRERMPVACSDLFCNLGCFKSQTDFRWLFPVFNCSQRGRTHY